MAIEKIKLANLGPIGDPQIEYIQKGNVVIEVKKRIPFEQLMDLIQWGINYSISDRTFVSTPLVEVMENFAIIKFFTNLDLSFIESPNCTPSEVYESYDIIFSTKVIEEVKQLIDPEELDFITRNFSATIHELMSYNNSAAGILDKISNEKMGQLMEVDTIKSILQEDPDIDKILRMFELNNEAMKSDK